MKDIFQGRTVRTALVMPHEIRIDGGTQSRAEINQSSVDEYAEAYYTAREALVGDPNFLDEAADALPAIDCVLEKEAAAYWLCDGFHRYLGAKQAELELVRIRYIVGTLEDARRFACAANQGHGLKRSNADKRHAVEMMLGIDPTASNVVIAEWCGVSDHLVGEARKLTPIVSESTSQPAEGGLTPIVSESTSQPSEPAPRLRVGKDGRTTNTANIGKKGGGGKGKKKSAKGGKKPAEKQEQVADALGQQVPSHLRDVFADARLDEQRSRVRTWHDAVEHAAVNRHLAALAPYYPLLSARLGAIREFLEEAHTNLAAAEEAIGHAVPYALCPGCEGDPAGCGQCDHRGYVARWEFDQIQADAAAEVQA